jgi:phosphoribosylglycinamide formyltransferase-1
MKIVGETLLNSYEGKIINIHPALLPSFKGAHGILDAFNYGVKVFGVTIHYVNSGIDEGKIISQKAFEYYGNDIEELETMIHKVEHELYPRTINELLKEL